MQAYQHSIGTWTLYLLTIMLKLSLLRAYLVFHKFDIICLPEIYLNSSYSPDDENLEISGYNLLRSEHSLNSKKWRVCIYYKNCLP